MPQGPKVYVLMENDNPIGVTKSKTKAEGWLFKSENDYLTFNLDIDLSPDEKAPAAPAEEHGKTPVQHLQRNVDRLDKGIDEADKSLKETVRNLQKRFQPKSRLLRRNESRTHERTSRKEV